MTQTDDITPAERITNMARAQAQQDVNEAETSLWAGGYSPRTMIGVWVGCSVLTVLAIIATFFIPDQSGVSRKVIWLGIACTVLAMWMWAIALYCYRRVSVHYELTTQRLIHKHGILVRTSDRIEMIDINDVAFTQGIFERMFQVGSIRISSNDRSHPELTLIGIQDVSKVAGMIDDARRRERRKRALHMA